MWWFAPRLVAFTVNGCVESQVSGVASGWLHQKNQSVWNWCYHNTEPSPTHHGTDWDRQHWTCTDTSRYRLGQTTLNLHRHITVPTGTDHTEPAPTHHGTDWDRPHWICTDTSRYRLGQTTLNLHRHITVPTGTDNTEPAPTHHGTNWDRQNWNLHRHITVPTGTDHTEPAPTHHGTDWDRQNWICTDTSRYRLGQTTLNLHRHITVPTGTDHTEPAPTQRQHWTCTDTSRYRLGQTTLNLHRHITVPTGTDKTETCTDTKTTLNLHWHHGTDWDRHRWTFMMDKSQMIWNPIQSDKSGWFQVIWDLRSRKCLDMIVSVFVYIYVCSLHCVNSGRTYNTRCVISSRL